MMARENDRRENIDTFAMELILKQLTYGVAAEETLRNRRFSINNSTLQLRAAAA